MGTKYSYLIKSFDYLFSSNRVYREIIMSALCNFVLAFLCFEFNSSFVIETQIPRPETVLVPVPFDKFQNIQWANDLDFMDSTCGVFKAYKGPTENVNK